MLNIFIKALEDDVKTPTNMVDDAGIETNHISKVLKKLKETGVADCINEDFKKGCLYKFTSLGEEMVDHLE